MTKNTSLFQSFSTARYAEWAGDIFYSHRLLTELLITAQETVDGREDQKPHRIVDPIMGMVGHAADELNSRLIRVAPTDEERALLARVLQQLTLETKHLRGVIHRLSSYEFELRAYLSDCSWESELYERAASAAQESGAPPLEPENDEVKLEIEQERNLPRLFEEMDEDEDREIDRGRGTAWIVDSGDFFREVTVGDLALILVKGVWAKRELPGSVDLIKDGFMEVLNKLDGTVNTNSRGYGPYTTK
jgi:hypothetical protein